MTVQTAKKHLEAWLEADLAVSTSQSYAIGGLNLTRADAEKIRKNIEYWENRVASLESAANGKGAGRFFRVLPRDL